MLRFRLRERPGAAFEREVERICSLADDLKGILGGRHPENMVSADAPVLDRWVIGHRLVPCLAGLSTGHPLMPGENRMIGTSDLWVISEDRSWARTLSRWYRLGRPVGHDDLHS